jgi:hypothetical protein
VTEVGPTLANRYAVQVGSDEQGWQVTILDPRGGVVWTRLCGGETEARTLASTIQQHVYWLSEPKFREYYRLEEAG